MEFLQTLIGQITVLMVLLMCKYAAFLRLPKRKAPQHMPLGHMIHSGIMFMIVAILWTFFSTDPSANFFASKTAWLSVILLLLYTGGTEHVRGMALSAGNILTLGDAGAFFKGEPVFVECVVSVPLRALNCWVDDDDLTSIAVIRFTRRWFSSKNRVFYACHVDVRGTSIVPGTTYRFDKDGYLHPLTRRPTPAE